MSVRTQEYPQYRATGACILVSVCMGADCCSCCVCGSCCVCCHPAA